MSIVQSLCRIFASLLHFSLPVYSPGFPPLLVSPSSVILPMKLPVVNPLAQKMVPNGRPWVNFFTFKIQLYIRVYSWFNGAHIQIVGWYRPGQGWKKFLNSIRTGGSRPYKIVPYFGFVIFTTREVPSHLASNALWAMNQNTQVPLRVFMRLKTTGGSFQTF